MTHSLIPDDSTRVGALDSSALNNDESYNPEITYPNSWTIPAGDPTVHETVEQAYPRHFLNTQPRKKSEILDTWTSNTYGLASAAQTDGQPIQIAGPNPHRKRLSITVASGPGTVWINDGNGTSGIGGGSVFIPTANAFVITHTGTIYAFSNGGSAVISVTEESYR